MKISAVILVLILFLGILVISLNDDDAGNSESHGNGLEEPFVEKRIPLRESDDANKVGAQKLGRNIEVGFLFSDSDISNEIQDIIIVDLKNVFSHLDVRISNDWVSFEGVGRKWPRALNGIGRVQERDGVPEIVIPKEVSDAYIRSFAFLKQQGIILSSVEREMIGIKEKMGRIPKENYGEWVEDLSFRLKLPDAPDEFLRGMMLSVGSDNIAFKNPSYLSFEKETIEGKEHIICELIVMGVKENEITHAEKKHFIQIDGKWKMIF